MAEIIAVQGIAADDIIREIRVAIAYAGLSEPAEPGGLELHAVEISLETVAEVKVGVGPKFKVPFFDWEVGAKYEEVRASTHTIEVTLDTPWKPKKGEREITPLDALPDVRHALVPVVDSLRAMLDVGAASGVALSLGTASAEFVFDVTRDGSLALAVPSAGRTWGSTVAVTFHFGPGS